jgi:hypothetical protein
MNTPIADQHIPVALLDRYVQGGLDRLEAARVQVHCDQCHRCEDQCRTIALRRAPEDKIVDDTGTALSECFSAMTMTKYANPDSDLTGDERALVRAHLANCFLCQTELELTQYDEHTLWNEPEQPSAVPASRDVLSIPAFPERPLSAFPPMIALSSVQSKAPRQKVKISLVGWLRADRRDRCLPWIGDDLTISPEIDVVTGVPVLRATVPKRPDHPKHGVLVVQLRTDDDWSTVLRLTADVPTQDFEAPRQSTFSGLHLLLMVEGTGNA